MELQICMTLQFDLQVVTALHFMDRFLDASYFTMGISCDNDGDDDSLGMAEGDYVMPRYNLKLQAMALFIVDTALLIPALVDVKDSIIAAAALYLARAIVGIRDEDGAIWNAHLVHHTGYRVDHLADTVSVLHFHHRDLDSNVYMKAIVRKYKTADYLHVARRTAILSHDLRLP